MRKSLALYYYTNGRPKNEMSDKVHATLFKDRTGLKDDTIKEPVTVKDVIRELVPPVLFKAPNKYLNKAEQ